MKDMIIVSDNTITKSECDHLIQLYETNSPTKDWLDYQVMTISPSVDEKSRDIVLKVAKRSGYYIDWCEIAKRPPGSGHPKHFDTTSDRTVFSSITYLNDDFTDGKTYFVNDFEVKPKTGRTLYFDGQCYEHGVTEVKGSDRYTLAIWYMKNV